MNVSVPTNRVDDGELGSVKTLIFLLCWTCRTRLLDENSTKKAFGIDSEIRVDNSLETTNPYYYIIYFNALSSPMQCRKF
jgi:hypothetical protein